MLTVLLSAAVAALSRAVLYQRIVFQAQMRQSLEMTVPGRVLTAWEQVMVFTQTRFLTGLTPRSTGHAGVWQRSCGGKLSDGRSGVCSPTTSPTIIRTP